MASVDNRVVGMKFDNKDFERNVSGTMKTLDKLKESLQFKGGKKGLEDVSAAADKVRLEPMKTSINGVNAAFAALATVGITTLANITSKAVDAGLKIAKSLTLDNVIDGFKEYETNINSIQTILANTESKGATLETVNAALDELNDYADKTIYNFAQMTRNVGTFTAAGLGLDESVRSIKGIANLAAVSGSTSEQASMAMYQLSQALASGVVRAQDWISVVNAGMGGEIFQKSLFETAKALGTIEGVPLDQTFEQWQDAGNNFKDSLEQQWITGEVLSTTLEGFTGELSDAELAAKGFSAEQIKSIQAMAATATAAASDIKTATQLVSVIQEAIGSGWASSFRIVVGDFEEAKELFSSYGNGISAVIGNISEARNNMLQAWKNVGGRDALIEGFNNALTAMGQIIRPIAQAFREFFPKKTAQDLALASYSFRDFTKKLKIGEGTAKKIKTAFQIFFGVLRIGWDIIKGITRVFFALVGVVAKVVGTLAEFFLGFSGGGVDAVSRFLTQGDKIEKFFNILVGAIKLGAQALGNFLGAIGKPIAAFLNLLKSGFAQAVDLVVTFAKSVGSVFGGLPAVFRTVYRAVERFVSELVNSISSRFDSVGDVFDEVKKKASDFVGSIGDLFKGGGPAGAGAAGGGGKKGGTWLDTIASYWSGGVDGAKNAFTKSIETVKSGLQSLADSTDVLDTIAKGIGSVLRDIVNFFKGFGDVIGGVGDKIADFATSFKEKIAAAFGSETYDKILDGAKVGLLGGLVAILAKFAKDGFEINFGFADEIIDSLESLGDTLKAMQTKIKAEAMKAIAIAIAILAGALFLIAQLDGEQVKTSLIAMGAGLAALLGSLAALTKIGGSEAKIGGMVVAMTGMSVALIALGGAILLFASIDTGTFINGILKAAAALVLLTAAAVALQYGSGGAIRAATSMIIMSVALTILSKVISIYDKIPLGVMVSGLLKLAATLAVLVVAMQFMPVTGMIKAAIAMTLFAFSLQKMSDVVVTFADLSWSDLIKGLLGLGASMLIMVGVMAALSYLDTGKASIGMLAMAASLYVIALAMEKIGSLDLFDLGKALISIIVVLGLLVASVLLIQGASLGVVGILALAFALSVMAGVLQALGQMSLGQIGGALLAIVGVLLVLGLAAAALVLMPPLAAGLVVLAGALLAIGVAFVLAGAGAWLIADALTKLSKIGSEGIDNLIKIIDRMVKKVPEWAKKFAEGLGSFIITVLELGPPINEAFGNLLSSILTLISEKVPEIADTFGVIIEATVGLLREKMPLLLDFAIEMIFLFGEKIRDNMQQIVELGGQIIAEFLRGMTTNVKLIGGEVLKLIQQIATYMGNHVQVMIDAGVFIFTKFIEGMGDAALEIGAEIEELIEKVAVAIRGVAHKLIDAGVFLFGELLEGLGDAAKDIGADIGELVDDIVTAITDLWEDFVDAGKELVGDLIDGMIDGIAFISNKFTQLAKTIGFAVITQIKVWGQVGIDILKALLLEGSKRISEASFYFGLFILSTLQGIRKAIETFSGPIANEGRRIAWALVQGIADGLGFTGAINRVKKAVYELAARLPAWMQQVLGIRSPSRVFAELAKEIPAGIAVALDKDKVAAQSSANLAGRVTGSFNEAMRKAAIEMADMDEMQPVIQPVLDLTGVKSKAKDLDSLLQGASLSSSISLDNAAVISAQTTQTEDSEDSIASVGGDTYVTFEQNNYSPESLSTADIYRNTRGQLAMAKEELKIP